MFKGNRRTHAAVAALAASLLVLTACSADAPPEVTPGDQGTVPEISELKIGIVGAAADAPLYIAQEKGWFDEVGLDVEIVTTGAGAASTSAVVSGSNHIGSGAIVPIIIAASQGLDLREIASANVGSESDANEGELNSAILVAEGSDISGVEDLAGKTIAVNALQSLGHIAVLGSLENQGVDVSTVNFIELGFPDMIPALTADRVDAIWEIEPFVTAAKAQGARAVDYPYESVMPHFPIAAFFATGEFVDNHPVTIELFTEVYQRAQAYAQENPDELRALVPTFTRIDESTAAIMGISPFVSKFSKENVEKLTDLMLRHGFIDSQPDMEKVFSLVVE